MSLWSLTRSLSPSLEKLEVQLGRSRLIIITSTLLISALVTLRWYYQWKARCAREVFAAKNGCKQPLRLKYERPFGIDLLVRAFKADKAGEILHLFNEIVYNTGNTFEQVLMGGKSFGTIDPVNIEAILNGQFHEFCLGGRVRNFRVLLGHGIFTQDGPEWKATRDLLRPQFMHTRSDNFDDVQSEVETFLTWVESDLKDGTVDLQPLFFRLTMNTTMAILFGRAYLTDLEEGEEAIFADAFNKAQHWLAKRGRLGDLYWLIGGSDFRQACSTVHNYVDKIVHSALEAQNAGASDATDTGRYIFLQALMERTKDPVALRDHLLNVLLAGRDTTACLLSWTFRLLAQHRSIQDRLRKECRELPSFVRGELPTKAELKRMQYLELVLREVLRLYPSVPVNARTATQTTTLPRGGGPDGLSPIVIEKGEELAYSVYSMHRSKEIWGADAEEFRPDRWVVGSTTMTNVGDVGWAYLPFNGGPRVCLGREFAMLEASYATVRLLQTYSNVEFAGPFLQQGTKEKQSLTLVLASAEGCNVKLMHA